MLLLLSERTPPCSLAMLESGGIGASGFATLYLTPQSLSWLDIRTLASPSLAQLHNGLVGEQSVAGEDVLNGEAERAIAIDLKQHANAIAAGHAQRC